MIINLDRENRGGTHWVCLAINPKLEYNIYFDSFGVSPSDPITKFLKKNGKEIKYNNSEIQQYESIMCGYYCMWVLDKLNKQKDIYDILMIFKQDPEVFNEKLIRKYGGQLENNEEGGLVSQAVEGLKFFGNMLYSNVKAAIDQRDKSERTKKMIKHYNLVSNNNQLAAMTRLNLLNIIRQMYSKNLTAQDKQKFLTEYKQILDNDKNEDHTKIFKFAGKGIQEEEQGGIIPGLIALGSFAFEAGKNLYNAIKNYDAMIKRGKETKKIILARKQIVNQFPEHLKGPARGILANARLTPEQKTEKIGQLKLDNNLK